MSKEKLENAGNILPHLFNSHKRRSKAVFPLELQQSYWQHFLEERWRDVCGENLNKLCGIEKLEGEVLIINTQSSTMANELFMIKKQLIKKINFLLQGMWSVKDLKFHTLGEIKQKKLPIIKDDSPTTKEAYGTCLKCGARLKFKDVLCTYCSREKKLLERRKIKELLLTQPWLDYTNCLNYLKCDKIEFDSIKDSLKSYFFERVSNNFADEHDEIIAVMLLTGKAIAEMDEKDFNNAIAFLRRKKNVSTRRF